MDGYSDQVLPLPASIGATNREADVATIERVTEQVTQYFHAYRDRLYLHLIHGEHAPAPEAEEITQEAFLALHRALLDGQQIRSVAAWVFTVARNLASKRRRKRRYERPLLMSLSEIVADAVPDRAPSSEDALHTRQRDAALRRAKTTLTPLQSRCLELRAEGLSLQEISQIAGVSAKRVSEAARRAIRRLQRHLNA